GSKSTARKTVAKQATSFCAHDFRRGRSGRQLRRAVALQRIDDRGLSRVVGRRIGAARDRNRPVGRVVIRQVLFVFTTVKGGLGFVAQPGEKLGEVKVRRQVFRV